MLPADTYLDVSPFRLCRSMGVIAEQIKLSVVIGRFFETPFVVFTQQAVIASRALRDFHQVLHALHCLDVGSHRYRQTAGTPRLHWSKTWIVDLRRHIDRVDGYTGCGHQPKHVLVIVNGTL